MKRQVLTAAALIVTTNVVASERDPDLAPRTAWAADQIDLLARGGILQCRPGGGQYRHHRGR